VWCWCGVGFGDEELAFRTTGYLGSLAEMVCNEDEGTSLRVAKYCAYLLTK
jgi:hypothetical protein